MLTKCKTHTPNLLLLQAAVSNIITKCNRSTNLPKLRSSQNATDTKSSFVTHSERERERERERDAGFFRICVLNSSLARKPDL
jgi:hypothetical protein